MIGYDIIGDVHGCADLLEGLLDELGYQEQDGAYRHLASGENRQPSSSVTSSTEAISRSRHLRSSDPWSTWAAL